MIMNKLRFLCLLLSVLLALTWADKVEDVNDSNENETGSSGDVVRYDHYKLIKMSPGEEHDREAIKEYLESSEFVQPILTLRYKSGETTENNAKTKNYRNFRTSRWCHCHATKSNNQKRTVRTYLVKIVKDAASFFLQMSKSRCLP